MKWAGLFLVLFAVLLFVSPLSLSAEEMAVITKAELKTLFDERKFLTDELQDYKQKYESLDQKYQTLDGKYLTQENELHLLKIESELRIVSLNDLKKTTNWNNIKSFLAGFGLGFGTGNYTGIRLRISF